MNIKNFEIDSQIVRVEPSDIGDRSYIGEKFIFKGIANGLIYLKVTDDTRIKIFNKDILNLRLIEFQNGWEYYKNPDNLIRKEKINKLKYISDIFNISENEIHQFIKILESGIIVHEKSEKIDKSLKDKLEYWIKINKK